MKKEELINYCKDELSKRKESLIELRDKFCGDVITTEKYILSTDEQYKKLYYLRLFFSIVLNSAKIL